MNSDADWGGAQAQLNHPAFASLAATLERLPGARWPDYAALNALVSGIANIRGAPLRFVDADAALDTSAAAYELGIALRGEIPTRQNWHDLFNALVWSCWPQAKSTISDMHARIIENQSEVEAQQRSVPRDVLTLFDESGAVILSDSPPMLDAIRGFRWNEVFLERRAEWGKTTTVLVFGHALMEKMLAPHLGITAKCVLMDCRVGSIPGQTAAELVPDVDARLATYFTEQANIRDTRSLQPLPVLGIPGWDARNESADFYANTDYFRPGRLRDRKGAVGADA